MITVTEQEHENMVASAEATLMAKSKAAKNDLKRGCDLDELYLPLCVAYANLVALEHYSTGKYEPAEYFNLVNPDDVSGMYAKVNSIDK